MWRLATRLDTAVLEVPQPIPSQYPYLYLDHFYILISVCKYLTRKKSAINDPEVRVVVFSTTPYRTHFSTSRLFRPGVNLIKLLGA